MNILQLETRLRRRELHGSFLFIFFNILPSAWFNHPSSRILVDDPIMTALYHFRCNRRDWYDCCSTICPAEDLRNYCSAHPKYWQSLGWPPRLAWQELVCSVASCCGELWPCGRMAGSWEAILGLWWQWGARRTPSWRLWQNPQKRLYSRLPCTIWIRMWIASSLTTMNIASGSELHQPSFVTQDVAPQRRCASWSCYTLNTIARYAFQDVEVAESAHVLATERLRLQAETAQNQSCRSGTEYRWWSFYLGQPRIEN